MCRDAFARTFVPSNATRPKDTIPRRPAQLQRLHKDVPQRRQVPFAEPPDGPKVRSLLGGTTADPMITVEIGTPGTVSLSGGVDMVGQIAAGHLNADGHVTLTSTGT